ncbi:isopentenyldiphosphate isomerase [Peptoniphilus ivorii]|uniref:NUDIX hydrolase n=1 Tax=Aedoeadaptatus ivorii TaxID=54006 RepID=UPI00277EB1F8|nr:NUDIX domain-containing protein [Peptoniphilus ivorii]MDQ0508389.1 isopentenyldiphosphate isomerase [Peptoniphilus ivorii]
MIEIWDLFDKDNRPTGETAIRGKRIPGGSYHRVVEGWIRTPDGKYILQKRARCKRNYPGFWSCTAIGSVIAGESPEDAMIREMEEEMGIRLTKEELDLERIITEFPAHYYIYRIEKDVKEEDIRPDPEEVEDFVFLTRDELRSWSEENHMTKLSYYEDFFKKWP